MDLPGGGDILEFSDAAEWESWLADHHESSAGAWLIIAKKNSGRASVTIGEALDVALCFGWIDSQRKPLDATRYLQRYSRRRPGGSWSRINVDRVDALIEAGRMREPGLREVTAAQADGRWASAYESQRNATVPPDLEAALAGNQEAQRAFGSLGRTERYTVILRIVKARTPEVRASRLQEAVLALEAAAGHPAGTEGMTGIEPA
ncbi:YdeI/OmpD-associated family protein [Glaciibacter sp. 2TAF33]|uniref:YdeI/OmpD-associated family protein n=1 Tax=Glaciibacter sp. 2TAF33 TaxID=3233015 RepID=UPI003F8E4DA0